MLCCKVFLSKAPASGRVSFTLNSLPPTDLSIQDSAKNSVLSFKCYLKVLSRNPSSQMYQVYPNIPSSISHNITHLTTFGWAAADSTSPSQKDTPTGSHLLSLLWEFCGWQGVETGTSGCHLNLALGVGVVPGFHIHVNILQQLYLLYLICTISHQSKTYHIRSHHTISYHVISYHIISFMRHTMLYIYMCVCIHIYICMYIYIYMCIYICICIYMCVYMYIYMCVCVYLCKYIYIYTYVYIYIYMY